MAQSHPPSPTQATRRTKYGINVAIAIVAAVALTVLLNVLVYWNRSHLPRWDMTATRQYDLSDQTLNVLSSLDQDVEFVTLFEDPDEKYTPGRTQLVTRARDLVDEYRRRSSRVQVTHIDPPGDPKAYERFLERIKERSTTTLEPLRQAIIDGRETLRNTQENLNTLADRLKTVTKNPGSTPELQIKQIDGIHATLLSWGQDIEFPQTGWNRELQEPLPDYFGLHGEVRSLLGQFDTGYGNLAKVVKQLSEDEQIDNAVKEVLFELSEQIEPFSNRLGQALGSLEALQPDSEYDQVRREVLRRDPVVLLSSDQVRAIGLDDMFRAPRGQTSEGERPDLSFLGEELLTAEIVSTNMKNPPMVVFVSGGQVPPLMPSQRREMTFTQVADRLRKMNLDVRQWSPGQMPTGRRPPEPKPQPAPGQKAVWVILPEPPFNPNPQQNPMAANSRNVIAEHVKQRLEVGDSMLIMMQSNFAAAFGQPDPLIDHLKPFGLTPQIDRKIFHQFMDPERQTYPLSQFRFNQWSNEFPVTAATAGMLGLFVENCPLVVGEPQIENATTHRMVQLSEDRMWADTDFADQEKVKFDKSAAAEMFDIAAAVETDKNRLVVICDPFWASDAITAMATWNIEGGNMVVGARFPANAELFVNSVYWLSGLDELIAASARSQDSRRVEEIGETKLLGMQIGLVAATPLLALAGGVCVWLVRRKD